VTEGKAAPADPLTVAVLVERDASARIAALADRCHVWAIDTPENRRAAEPIWRRRRAVSQRLSLTLLQFDPVAPEEVVARAMEGIELHRGEASQSPPWRRAEVFGAAATPALLAVFRQYGFNQLDTLPGGFSVERPA
jgi:hypothetical protein